MVKGMRVLFFLVVSGSWLTPGPLCADYAGVAVCATCHPAIAASWAKTAHARAGSKEVLGPKEHSALCLSCHATGDGLRAQGKLPGVQCEACHGGGADYFPDDIMRDKVLARALGLRDAGASCMRCHVANLGTIPFEFDAFWAKIAH